MGNEKERFFDTFLAWLACLYRFFWGNGPGLVLIRNGLPTSGPTHSFVMALGALGK